MALIRYSSRLRYLVPFIIFCFMLWNLNDEFLYNSSLLSSSLIFMTSIRVFGYNTDAKGQKTELFLIAFQQKLHEKFMKRKTIQKVGHCISLFFYEKKKNNNKIMWNFKNNQIRKTFTHRSFFFVLPIICQQPALHHKKLNY